MLSLKRIDHFLWWYLCVNHYLFAVRNTFNVVFWISNAYSINSCFCLRLSCIAWLRILISSFDDNDGDGIAYSTRYNYKFSILEGSWHPTTSREFFSGVSHWDICLVVDCDHCQFVFLLCIWLQFRHYCLGIALFLAKFWKVCKPNTTVSLHP